MKSNLAGLHRKPTAWHRALLAALLLAVVNPLILVQAAPLPQSVTSEERAKALMESGLTPEERVGQLFLVTFTGTDIGPDSQIYDLIVNHHIGGVIIQAENDNFAPQPQTLSKLLELTRGLQSTERSATLTPQIEPGTDREFDPAFIPMFIGISQEGNGSPYDTIINGMTPLPSEMAIGATWQPELANQVGTVLGSELSSLGINLLLGPSLDVLDNPQPQGTGDLGVRTFGGDPYWVGQMGESYISGVHTGSSGRIAVVAKHFPGHGSSGRLPEEEVATVRKSLEQLKQIELPPFISVTGNAPNALATTDALLASHIRYQGFQGNIRETTRPVSLDPQAFAQLLSLPALATWRENGGVMVSDNLGSRAFRRFIDPTGQTFNARIIARDAFSTTGNDLLYLGSEFIDTGDPDTYTTIVRTLDFFAKKYREDPSFQQRVDESVLRILTLKYRLYQNIFALDQVLPSQNSLANIGKSSDVTFNVAQSAATLISPSLDELPNILPQPPGLNDRIVFITDARSAQQCSECLPQPAFEKDALEKAVIQLYGPLAGGQVLQRNLKSYTFMDLLNLLDSTDQENPSQLEIDLNQADWLVFSMLNVSTNIPESSALSRFLAERPDLFQQKKLVVFAFDAPYFLDTTEISKLSAYYGLYSKTNKFVEVAARLLFGEIPAPPGDLPVSVPGVDYDLIAETSPDPNQTILLFLDRPESAALEGTPTPEPTLAPEFEVGDLIAVRTGEIMDHNGHPVPDDTPVKFTMIINGETSKTTVQNEQTVGGIASTTFLIEQAGTLEIRAESISATESTLIRYEIPPNGAGEILPTPTVEPTQTATISPTQTASPVVEETDLPPIRDKTNLADWFLAMLVTFIFGGIVYWLTSQVGMLRWGVRGSLLALTGGFLAYTYLAAGMPGSSKFMQSSGTWGVLLVTVLGSCLGWMIAYGWHRVQTNARNQQLTNDGGQQA